MDGKLYLFVARRLAEAIPEVGRISEDLGELDDYAAGFTDGYPLPPKAIFIGNCKTKWEDKGGGLQIGTRTFTVRLAVDCYDDTHLGSGTEEKVLERADLNQRIYLALQGGVVNPGEDYICRLDSDDYVLPGNKIVYVTTFGYTVQDNSAFRALVP